MTARAPVSEHAEQAALIATCRLHAHRYPALRNVYAIPNASKRGYAVARYLLDEGMVAGVPDLHLAWPAYVSAPDGGLIWKAGLFIELKVGSNRPTKAQRDWLDRLNAAGYRAVVCYGFAAAWAEICAYVGIAEEGQHDE